MLLAPPSVHHDMALYPSMHPSYHQSQLEPDVYSSVFANISNSTDERLNNIRKAAFAVLLQPGDVLYIPRKC